MKRIKGITLIALVITIIVLLILAGVSISVIMSDNGIVEKAERTKLATKATSIIEVRDMWKNQNSIDKENPKPLEDVLDELQASGTISQEEKNQIKENNFIQVGDEYISFSEGLAPTFKTVTYSDDIIEFIKIVKEADIKFEKPDFKKYEIIGISNTKEGPFVNTGTVEGKAGSLEVIGTITEGNFKFNLKKFMLGDETFYCQVNIDDIPYYKELKVIQGDVVKYEDDFMGIKYEGNWTEVKDEKASMGHIKVSNNVLDRLTFNCVLSAIDLDLVCTEDSGAFMMYFQNSKTNKNENFLQVDTNNSVNLKEHVKLTEITKKEINFETTDLILEGTLMHIAKFQGDTNSKINIDAIYIYR